LALQIRLRLSMNGRVKTGCRMGLFVTNRKDRQFTALRLRQEEKHYL
jgi:hypothetical protein